MLRTTGLDKLEKASRLRCNSNYLISDKALRQYVKPADACTVDPMHDAVANGFVHAELYCSQSGAGACAASTMVTSNAIAWPLGICLMKLTQHRLILFFQIEGASFQGHVQIICNRDVVVLPVGPQFC